MESTAIVRERSYADHMHRRPLLLAALSIVAALSAACASLGDRLAEAVDGGRTAEVVSILEEARGDPDARPRRWMLRVALKQDNLELADLLTRAGVDAASVLVDDLRTIGRWSVPSLLAYGELRRLKVLAGIPAGDRKLIGSLVSRGMPLSRILLLSLREERLDIVEHLAYPGNKPDGTVSLEGLVAALEGTGSPGR